MNVLITGATGYLGSHICEYLLDAGHTVLATRRASSSLEKCRTFSNRVEWVDTDVDNWQASLTGKNIELIIHAAWAGVTYLERNDWNTQLKNYEFSKLIIDLAVSLGIKRIVALGSQAEYGIYNFEVDETFAPSPNDAYASVKLLVLYYLKVVGEQSSIKWNWLRVFSVIGGRENANWLIPSVLKKLYNDHTVELTEGLQYYDYLYIDDFVYHVASVIEKMQLDSGIFNICSGVATQIRKLLLEIVEQIGKLEEKLIFGAIPYRKGQNMYMVGSPKKYENLMGAVAKKDSKQMAACLLKS